MTTYLSGDKTMLEAYNTGKDLYAMIAMSAFDNNYEDNLEFWPEGTELEINGKKNYAGSGKEKTITTEDNAIVIPCFYLVQTDTGELTAADLTSGMKVISSIGELTIQSTEVVDAIQLDGGKVPQVKISFIES